MGRHVSLFGMNAAAIFDSRSGSPTRFTPFCFFDFEMEWDREPLQFASCIGFAHVREQHGRIMILVLSFQFCTRRRSDHSYTFIVWLTLCAWFEPATFQSCIETSRK